MISITTIKITNFFGRGDFEWYLNDYVNILGGKNGSGKSTIFRFCYLLLTNENIDQTIHNKYSAIADSLVIVFSNKWKLIWSKNDSEKGVTLYLDPANIRTQITTSVYDETGKKRSYKELKELIRVYLINSFEQHLTSASQYLKDSGTSLQDDPTLLDLMIKEQIDIRNKEFSRAMEAMMDDDTVGKQAMADYSVNYKKIYHVMKNFFQEYDNKFDSGFTFKKGDQTFSYEFLSMGEKQLLLLLLMVSNDNLQPCIFFMDEPDLSMHIDWKEKLLTELNKLNPSMQIIVSTHAPSLITGWMDCVSEMEQLIK